MRKYSIVVDWDDMPFGFKSWLLHLEKDMGMTVSYWSNNDNGTTTGMGFDIEEDDYRDNKIYAEMIMKFCVSKRKTKLKQWTIIDHVKERVLVHKEE